jgi:hypothetical protein
MAEKCVFLRIDGTKCEHPIIAGATSPDRCAGCSSYRGRARGLGDVVHSITHATGIAQAVDMIAGGPCGGCAARRAALNAAVPFSDEGKKD